MEQGVPGVQGAGGAAVPPPAVHGRIGTLDQLVERLAGPVPEL